MAGLLIRELKPTRLDRARAGCLPCESHFSMAARASREVRRAFLVLKGADIRDQFGVNQWLEQKQVITSLDVAKRTEILPSLRQAHWDLVIVDEAHRMFGPDESTLRPRRLPGSRRPTRRRCPPPAASPQPTNRRRRFGAGCWRTRSRPRGARVLSRPPRAAVPECQETPEPARSTACRDRRSRCSRAPRERACSSVVEPISDSSSSRTYRRALPLTTPIHTHASLSTATCSSVPTTLPAIGAA